MTPYIIVWNESKTEGVIFRNEMSDDGEDDAKHAANQQICNPCSSLGDAFVDLYGEDELTIQEVQIDTSAAVNAEDF